MTNEQLESEISGLYDYLFTKEYMTLLKDNNVQNPDTLFFGIMSLVMFAIAVRDKPDDAKKIEKDVFKMMPVVLTNDITTVTNAFCDGELPIEPLEQNVAPMVDKMLLIAGMNKSIEYASVQEKVLSIFKDWSLLVLGKEPSTSFYRTIVRIVKFFNPETDEVSELSPSGSGGDYETSVNNSSDDYIPVSAIKMGAEVVTQEYINAPNSYDVYMGVDIKNPNVDMVASNLKLVATFYKNGMMIDKSEQLIYMIEMNSVLHFGFFHRINERFDKYEVRVVGGEYFKVDNDKKVTSLFPVSNLNSKVDTYNDETKVSCRITNGSDRQIRCITACFQFIKDGEIVAGAQTSEYDIMSGDVCDFITSIDKLIKADSVVCSVIPYIG